jgi:urease accessory protein
VDGTIASAPVDAIPAPSARAFEGAARVAFRHREGRTQVADLYQQSPLRVLFPTPDDPLPLAVLVNSAGGLVGGDRMSTEVTVDEGAAAVVTMQAAEKAYRSTGTDTRLSNRVKVAPGGWLEWLPQETIVFDRARLRRTMRIDLAGNAAVLAGEILVFGRAARGERMTSGLVHDAWEVRRDGRLLWADALHLDGDVAETLADLQCFAGGIGYATLIYTADDAANRLEGLRAAMGDGDLHGATCVGSLLVARWLSREPHRMRQAFARAWCVLREARGLPAQLPRIWHV